MTKELHNLQQQSYSTAVKNYQVYRFVDSSVLTVHASSAWHLSWSIGIPRPIVNGRTKLPLRMLVNGVDELSSRQNVGFLFNVHLTFETFQRRSKKIFSCPCRQCNLEVALWVI